MLPISDASSFARGEVVYAGSDADAAMTATSSDLYW